MLLPGRGTGGVGLCHLIDPPFLVSGQLGRFLSQIGHVPLERGPTEQFPAPFDGLPQLLLGLGQIFQRLPCFVGVEILQGPLQLVQPRAQFG